MHIQLDKNMQKNDQRVHSITYYQNEHTEQGWRKVPKNGGAQYHQDEMNGKFEGIYWFFL